MKSKKSNSTTTVNGSSSTAATAPPPPDPKRFKKAGKETLFDTKTNAFVPRDAVPRG